MQIREINRGDFVPWTGFSPFSAYETSEMGWERSQAMLDRSKKVILAEIGDVPVFLLGTLREKGANILWLLTYEFFIQHPVVGARGVKHYLGLFTPCHTFVAPGFAKGQEFAIFCGFEFRDIVAGHLHYERLS